MRLCSMEVKNYRSIYDTETLRFHPNKTVIIGPNNEGKSNLLKALVVAVHFLDKRNIIPLRGPAPSGEVRFRTRSREYSWGRDFPLGKQGMFPDGETTLKLDFKINANHEREIKRRFNLQIRNNLPLVISMSHNEVRYQVKKPGLSRPDAKLSSELAFFIGTHFSLEYIPAIRPSDMSIDIVRSLVERQLNLLFEDEAYVEAMKTVENLQTDLLSALGAEVQDQLRHLLPTVKSVNIEAGSTNHRLYRPFRTYDISVLIDDGSETQLEEKGDGVKSLAAIALMRASGSSERLGGLLLAIEEPEAHLHPYAVRQIAKVLNEMAEQHQVVISTHSPLLVARDHLDANILVEGSRASVPTDIQEVRDALGVEVGDDLHNARHVLLVEGTTDKDILKLLAEDISPKFAEVLRSGQLVIFSLDGVNNAKHHIRILREMVIQPMVLLDDDPDGKVVGESITENDVLEPKFVSYLKRTNRHHTELEDFLSPSLYLQIVSEELGLTVNEEEFQNRPEHWSRRVEWFADHAGRRLTPQTELQVKKNIVSKLQIDQDRALCPQNAPQLKSILDTIAEQVAFLNQQ